MPFQSEKPRRLFNGKIVDYYPGPCLAEECLKHDCATGLFCAAPNFVLEISTEDCAIEDATKLAPVEFQEIDNAISN